MADGIKYQPTGRVFADIPSLSFANVRESFKRSESMSQSLDKLSQFAGKFAAERIEEEAEQWAVNNAYSYEQILEAQKQGITADDLVASTGGGAIWQKTVRKIQGEQLRIELEGLGRQGLAGIQAAVETRQLTDPNEIAMKIDALGQGLFAPLRELSPDSYVKGKNAFGLHASSVYNDARKQIVADIKSQATVTADENFAAIMELNKKTILNLNDIESLDAAKNLTAQRVYEDYAKVGNVALATQMAQKARVEFDNQVINYFSAIASSDLFANDRYEAMLKVRNNDFGEKSNIYNALDEDSKKKIRVAASEGWTALEQSKLQREKEQKEVADKTFRTNVIAKTSRAKSGKLNTFDNAFLDGALSYSEWKSANNPEGEMGDPVMLSNIENKILDNKITKLDQLPAGLSPKAKAKFNLLIRNQDEKNAKRILRQGANIVEGSAFHTATQSEKYAKLEVIYDKLSNEVDANGMPKYLSKADAAAQASKEYSNSTTVVTARDSQRAALVSATKEISADDFNYDIPRDRKSLETYAAKNVSFSQRDKWVKAVLRYQQNKKITGLGISDIENPNQGNN
jgi:hypothetical protein